LTPRQRIVVRREMTRLREREPRSPELRELERDFRYDALETCATDGLCALSCPVSIDTGALTKRLRHETHPRAAVALARFAATRFTWVERASRAALSVAALGRRLSPVAATLPPAGPLPLLRPADPAAVYFASCVSRVVGPPAGERAIPHVVAEVARRAGVDLAIPRCDGFCCGMPFSSRGYHEAYRLALARTVDALWEWSDGGRLPLLVDSSPCAWTLRGGSRDLSPTGRERLEALQILDGIEFAEQQIVPRIRVRSRLGRVALHPVCSVRKLGLEERMRALAGHFADEVVVPVTAGCCGMAGDRGLRLPELPRAAIAPEAAELAGMAFDGYFSSSRTCEVALTRATGRPFRSIWHLVEEATG
jgi:D-lactate dehydrogenase